MSCATIQLPNMTEHAREIEVIVDDELQSLGRAVTVVISTGETLSLRTLKMR